MCSKRGTERQWLQQSHLNTFITCTFMYDNLCRLHIPLMIDRWKNGSSVLFFFCQIFGLLVLKVNLEFKFHHIFIPFKWQFHKISWIINKPHKAYNFYDKTKWDFLTLHRPDSTDLVLAVYQCPKTGSRREVVLQKQDGTSLYITRYLLLIIKGTCLNITSRHLSLYINKMIHVLILLI